MDTDNIEDKGNHDEPSMEVDSAGMDIFTANDQGYPKRPRLTTMMDVYSGMVVALYLSFDENSTTLH